MTRKLDEIISDIEDVGRSLDEARAGVADNASLEDAQETLESVTDRLEAIDEDEE
jgi:exonuclease VII small subunit